MPKDEYEVKCKRESYEDPDSKQRCRLNTVADYFDVSYDAALSRGKNLSLFEW